MCIQDNFFDEDEQIPLENITEEDLFFEYRVHWNLLNTSVTVYDAHQLSTLID